MIDFDIIGNFSLFADDTKTIYTSRVINVAAAASDQQKSGLK